MRLPSFFASPTVEKFHIESIHNRKELMNTGLHCTIGPNGNVNVTKLALSLWKDLKKIACKAPSIFDRATEPASYEFRAAVLHGTNAIGARAAVIATTSVSQS
jgi:hypothetical protein